MGKTIRSHAVLVIALSLTGVLSFAQPGEAVYKAKCQACHGADGMGNTAVGRALKVRSVNDPAVRASDEAQMTETTRNGVGRMQAFRGELTDAQIKDAVTYFRALAK